MEAPTEAFGKILKALRICAILVGCNVLLPDYRINIMTGLVGTCIVAYFTFSFVTVLHLYKEDWMIILEAFCLASSVFQGAVKLISTIASGKTIRKLYHQLIDIYADYEKQGPKYSKALSESCSRLTRVLKIIFVLYMVNGAAITAIPFVLLVITGERYLIMKVYFPYLDVATTSGYYATVAIHSVFMFVGTFGLFASDLLIFIYLMQSFLFADIFRLKIEDLNTALEEREPRRHTLSITEQLKDIVKWHQIYSEYTKTCNDMFYYVVTVMVTTAGVSIIFCGFIILTGDWPGAYPYILIGIYTLYVYCILGTRIEICNDEFCTEIYNISWFNLNVSQQKIVETMLMQSQQPQTIYIAGVLPLSVSTALQITKTIYSIFTMMVRFILE